MAVPTYVYSGVCYTATAGQTTFALTTTGGDPIGYLKQEHIYVSTSADGGNTWTGLTLNTDYVFTDPATAITLNTPATAGLIVQLKRNTPLDDDYIEFQAGSLLTADQLNTFDTWQLYIDQELSDRVDSKVAGASFSGVAPIQVDVTNPDAPVVSIDETTSTGDPNSLTSDTRVMSEKAIDEAFKQYVGTSPAIGEKIGQIRIDDTGTTPRLFYWNQFAWVEIGTEGPQGPAGPAPGLQTPAASATTVPNQSDGSLGVATANVVQDPNTSELKFLFGVPAGVQGAQGPQGPAGSGVTYLGIIDVTTATEPSSPSNGDFYLNNTDGTSSWTGLSTVTNGDRIIWNGNTNQWDRFPPPPSSGLQPGDNVSELVNDAGYLTTATLPAPSATLQQVLDNGNTSTTDLYIGASGQTVHLANTGNGSFSGKVTSAATASTDGATTLVTKGYVDSNTGSQVIVSDSAPSTTGLDEGTQWWNSDADDLSLYVLYDDPSPDAGLKWISATPGIGGGSSAFVALNDGGTKQVIESAGLGLSDGTTENITLGGDGTGTFAGTIQAGGDAAAGAAQGAQLTESGTVVATQSAGASAVFQGHTQGTSTATSQINGDGSAQFNNLLRVGNAFNVGDGAEVYASGLIALRKDGSANQTVLQVLTNGGATANEMISLKNSGSAYFNNGEIVKDQPSGNNSANPALQIKHGGTINGSWRHSGLLELGGQDANATVSLNPSGISRFYNRLDVGIDATPVTGTGMYIVANESATGGGLNVRNTGTGPIIVGRDSAGYDKFQVTSNGSVSTQNSFITGDGGGTAGSIFAAGTASYLSASGGGGGSGSINLYGSANTRAKIITLNTNSVERVELDHVGTFIKKNSNNAFYAAVNVAANQTNYVFAGANTGATSSYIWSNGNIQNTNNSYGAISDIKNKENIVEANSQWDDIKAIKLFNYNFTAESGFETHKQLGVIAQQVEEVSPKLVGETRDTGPVEVPVLDEDGRAVMKADGTPETNTEIRETGETTKNVAYSVLHLKALGALQEAMKRIEELEERVTKQDALIAQLTSPG